jgi:hypothetical protein
MDHGHVLKLWATPFMRTELQKPFILFPLLLGGTSRRKPAL